MAAHDAGNAVIPDMIAGDSIEERRPAMNIDSQGFPHAGGWTNLFKRLARLPGALFLTTALAVFLLGQPFVKYDPFPHHEGSILYPAYAVNHGLLLLKDVTLQHLPTTSLLYAVALSVFGETLIVTRFLTLVGICCFAGLLATLAGRFLPRWLAFGFAVSYAVSSWLIWDLITRPWPTLWAMCFLLAGGLALCDYILTGKRGFLVLAGVCVGWVFLFRLNIGVYAGATAVAILAGFAWTARKQSCRNSILVLLKNAVTCAFPALILVGLVLGVYMYSFGADGLFGLMNFQRYIVGSMQALATSEYGPSNQYSLFHDLGISRDGLSTLGLYVLTCVVGCGVLFARRLAWMETAALGVVVLLGGEQLRCWHSLDLGIPVIVVALWDWWRNSMELSAHERNLYLVLIGTAVASWGGMFPGHDPRYLAWGGGTIFLLIAVRIYWLWRNSCEQAEVKKAFLGVFSIALWLLVVNAPHARHLLQVLRTPRVLIATTGFYKSMSGDSTDKRGYADYVAVREYVRKYSGPQETVLILDGESLHSADWERTPASLPYISLDNIVYRLPQGPEIERNMIAEFMHKGPKLVLKAHRHWEVGAAWFEPAFPKLKAFIESSYQPVWESPSGFYTILAPRSHNEPN